MKDSVKYVKCTFCEWVKTYIDPQEKESAWLAANEHALRCEHDPRNAELAALRAEVAGLKAERDALKSSIAHYANRDNWSRGYQWIGYGEGPGIACLALESLIPPKKD